MPLRPVHLTGRRAVLPFVLAVLGAALVAGPVVGAASTKRISDKPNGKQANGTSIEPGLSGDGRHVVFGSQATNLKKPDLNGTWDIFRRGPLR